jgi:hypothetical protein
MTQPGPTRKARFRAALALAGMTVRDWCQQQGYSEPHVYLFLAGRRDSQTLTDKMEAFIDQYLSQHAA